jgi:hypothetical protein
MWLTAVTLAGALGLLFGWESSSFKNDSRYKGAFTNRNKSVFLGVFALGIGLQVESVRGFIIVYLSSLGCYYLAKHVGGLAEIFWYRWRNPHPVIEDIKIVPEKNIIRFFIQSKCTSPIQIETVFLRGEENRIIPIEVARVFEDEIIPDRDGWLRLKGYGLRSRGCGSIELNSSRFYEATALRLLGRYGNSEYWVVDQIL